MLLKLNKYAISHTSLAFPVLFIAWLCPHNIANHLITSLNTSFTLCWHTFRSLGFGTILSFSRSMSFYTLIGVLLIWKDPRPSLDGNSHKSKKNTRSKKELLTQLKDRIRRTPRLWKTRLFSRIRPTLNFYYKFARHLLKTIPTEKQGGGSIRALTWTPLKIPGEPLKQHLIEQGECHNISKLLCNTCGITSE